MKRSILAVVLGSALAMPALAGVTLYGTVNESLSYDRDTSHTDFNQTINLVGPQDQLPAIVQAYKDIDLEFPIKVATSKRSQEAKFGMRSDRNSGSFFGIEVTENISDRTIVGAKLEGGLKANTGTMDDSKRFFNRTTEVFIQGPFGRLGAGLIPNFEASYGSYNFYAKAVNPFVNLGPSVGSLNHLKGDAYSNTVVYQTPTFAGFTGYGLYSLDANNAGSSNSVHTKKLEVGASYEHGPFSVAALVTHTSLPSLIENGAVGMMKNPNDKNPFTFAIGGNIDLNFVKLFAGVQYMRNARNDTDALAYKGSYLISDKDPFSLYQKGWNANIGAQAPLGNGTLVGNVSWSQLKGDIYQTGAIDLSMQTTTATVKSNRLTLDLRYDYNLSKRTSVYVGGVYSHQVRKGDALSRSLAAAGYQVYQQTDSHYKFTKNSVGAYVGLKHSF